MLRKVLVPTDFSPGYEGAVVAFEKRNELPVGEVVLLHVVEEDKIEVLEDISEFEKGEVTLDDVERELVELAERRLETERERLKRAFRTTKVTVLVRVGVPWREIVSVADEEDVSLIFLPSHGRLGFSRELLGSTTMRVLKETSKPVLIIKARG